MSAIIITRMSSSARDANRMIARQQQATIQTAIHAWVTGTTRNEDGEDIGINRLRIAYNAAGNTAGRLQPIAPQNAPGYLDDGTRDHFWTNSANGNRIESFALKTLGQHITLPDWLDGDYPKALLLDN
jgi:hypothetical protein